MQYIEQSARNRVAPRTGPRANSIEYKNIETPGELQYAIALIIKSFLSRQGLNCQRYNDVLGVLSGVTQEFYRRVIAPYENKKINENGDII